jgi:hypothetical protein
MRRIPVFLAEADTLFQCEVLQIHAMSLSVSVFFFAGVSNAGFFLKTIYRVDILLSITMSITLLYLHTVTYDIVYCASSFI